MSALACLSACKEDLMLAKDSDEIFDILGQTPRDLDEDTFLENLWIFLVSKECVTEKEVSVCVRTKERNNAGLKGKWKISK